jgi:UDP-2-acetamido-2,6-beta-L-arabino-hexul-4-ose reductase
VNKATSPITVGITGPRGFIAGHVMRRLSLDVGVHVVPCGRAEFANPASLTDFVNQCDTIVHLAGMNRGNEREIYDTNTSLVDRLVDALVAGGKTPHVVFASSAQRDRSSAYGRSKKYGEERLRQWATQCGAPLTILIIPNVFGPGCRPYYDSLVATFCHQLSHDQRPVVIDDQEIELVWVNDLAEGICQIIRNRRTGVREARVAGSTKITVSKLLDKLHAMQQNYFETNIVPDLSNPFDANLYTTFLSHIDLDDHRHRPQLRTDERGQLFEILRLAGGGQIVFSTTKPGVIRGNHFHSRKIEWFCVVRGEAVIRLRRVGDSRVREFRVSGYSPEFISIPALHTHQIENVGNEDLLTMFWCNEIFQPADPDTFQEKVA